MKPLRSLSTAAAFGALAACNEQSFVTYQGTVTQSEEAGCSFADEAPADAIPVADASVSLCEESKCRATTDERGAWGPAWQSFPLFAKRVIAVRVEAEGFEPFTYRTRYPSTDDPVRGERLLNVRLRKVDRADGGATDADLQGID